MAKNHRRPAISPTQQLPPIIQRVALYARVSTKDQHCELQLRELREYAARLADRRRVRRSRHQRLEGFTATAQPGDGRRPSAPVRRHRSVED